MIEVVIPGEAPSTPNLREHWAAKAKRVKAQRAAVARKMPAWPSGPLLIVRLTRVAPRALDSDNLAGALKGHRDAVAARLRVDDGSPLVEWRYMQAKGEASVVVQMWPAGEEAPPAYWRGAAPKRVKGKLKPASNSAPRGSPAYSPPPMGLGSEVMREMLKPPGKEDYAAAVLRVLDAEDRALSAAQLAEETFAPGPHSVTCRCDACASLPQTGQP